MILSGTLTVTGVATLIHQAAGATRLAIYPTTTTVIYLGDSGVTFGNGLPIAFGSQPSAQGDAELNLSDGDALYGISNGGSVAVNFIATN